MLAAFHFFAERCDEEVTVHVSPEISINTTRAQAELLERQLAAATPGERIDFKVFDPGQTRAEQQRLERLCWQQGFRPTKQDLQRLLARFAVLVSSHMAEAGKQQKRGAVEPPKPSLKKKGITWQQVLKAKENELIAAGTSKGIHNAVKRLQDFSKAQFGVFLPSEIDTDMALAYRNWLFGPESPIRISSAGKEIRFINSALTAAVKQQLLLTNPSAHCLKTGAAVTCQKHLHARTSTKSRSSPKRRLQKSSKRSNQTSRLMSCSSRL